MSFEDYTEEEIERWLWLRAIEWGGFPAFISQAIAPILFLVYPWWHVILGFVCVNLVWCMIRHAFVSVALSTTACLVGEWLKVPPVAIGSAIYLFVHHQPLAAVVALIWPLIAAFTIPPGKVGVIELRLAKRIVPCHLMLSCDECA